VKLNGNLLLRDFLEMNDVRILDRVLEQEVQLMVNIAPSTMDDKNLVDEYTKIRKSVTAALDAISVMANSEVPNVSLAKYVSDWQGQVSRIKYIQGKFARYIMTAVDSACDRHVMLQGLPQLKESGGNLLTGYTDPDQKARALDTVVETGRESAYLHYVIMLVSRHCRDVLDTSCNCKPVQWVEDLDLKHHLLIGVLFNGGPRKKANFNQNIWEI
jgi:hypothetical protein